MIEERSSEDQPSTNIINDGGKVDPGRLESIYEQESRAGWAGHGGLHDVT